MELSVIEQVRLIASGQVKANLSRVKQNLDFWNDIHHLELGSLRATDHTAVWSIANCIIAAREMTDELTELLLIAATRTSHDWVFGFQPEEAARSCWNSLFLLWPRDLVAESYKQVGLPMLRFPLDIAGWAQSELEPSEFHLLGKIGSQLDERFGPAESARFLPDEIRKFREQIEIARAFKREMEATQDVTSVQLADRFFDLVPGIPIAHTFVNERVAEESLPDHSTQVASPANVSKDENKPGRGRHELDHAELIYRLAKAQEAKEIRAQVPDKRWKEIAKEIGWRFGTDKAGIKLLEDARHRLRRVRDTGDQATLDEIAQFRKEKKIIP